MPRLSSRNSKRVRNSDGLRPQDNFVQAPASFESRVTTVTYHWAGAFFTLFFEYFLIVSIVRTTTDIFWKPTALNLPAVRAVSH